MLGGRIWADDESLYPMIELAWDEGEEGGDEEGWEDDTEWEDDSEDLDDEWEEDEDDEEEDDDDWEEWEEEFEEEDDEAFGRRRSGRPEWN